MISDFWTSPQMIFQQNSNFIWLEIINVNNNSINHISEIESNPEKQTLNITYAMLGDISGDWGKLSLITLFNMCDFIDKIQYTVN